MDARPNTEWEEFTASLKIHFGHSPCEDSVGAFPKLRQISNIEEYQMQFEILSNIISELIEEFRMSTFLNGLKDEVRIIVTMLHSLTLSATFELARLQEEEVLRSNQTYKPNNLLSTSIALFK